MVFRDVGDRFKDIKARLGKRVIGQKKAVDSLAHRLVLNKGPLKDGFDRPDGVLLFLGPTGVGKTELAKALAAYLFGDEKKMVRIDMSEYQDGWVAVEKLSAMRARAAPPNTSPPGPADRRTRARPRAAESAQGPPPRGGPARRGAEGGPVDAERVP